MRPSVVGLAMVLAVAAVLRFWALGSGIPFAVGAGEPEIMTRVVRMMQTGDFNPHSFGCPALYIYVQLAVACVHFVLGVGSGAFGSLAGISDANLYLWARAVTALLGTATVYVVYVTGTRWGARHALLAASLMAVMPYHVRESHYVLTDVPMAFLTTLSFLFTLRALEKQTLGAFAWAGATAGLAAATKYYGGLMLVAPVLAAFLVSNPQRTRRSLALAAVGAAAGCFVAAAPYTVLDLPGFLDGFAGALQSRALNAEPGWLAYLRHTSITLWYPGMVLLFWGLVLAIVRAIRGPGKARFTLLVVCPTLYFLLVSSRTQVFARYLMPLVPFISLLVAIAIVSGVTLLRRFNIPRPARTSLIVALTVVAILPPAVSSISWDGSHGRPSTYTQAYDWIVEHVPSDAGVVVESGTFRLPRPYRSMNVSRLTDNEYEAYVRARMTYAVLAGERSAAVFDAPGSDPDQFARYRRLLDRMSLVAAFKRAPTGLSPDIRIFKLIDDRPQAAPAVERTGAPK
jgi:4-amino-4-deoxy-L-arabinose transferase-like glycosyltransferase